MAESRTSVKWTFLTNHAHVLVCVARDPGVRLRDVAERVGITERATQGIIGDLVAAGYVDRRRIGRRNHYSVRDDLPMRHPLDHQHQIGDLLDLLIVEVGSRSSFRAVAERSADTDD